MVFSSPLFLYVFLPIFFALYYLAPFRFKNWILLVANLLFYVTGAGVVIFALTASVLGNHFLAIRLADPNQRWRDALLGIGVTLNFAGLIYYKYTPFLWSSFDSLINPFGLTIGPSPSVLLPIGISFFTFQAVSYIVDVYRNEAPPAASYGYFAIYHTLFPQLIAGPIVRYREIRESLYARSMDVPRMSEGAYRFCLGLGKKIILADNLGLCRRSNHKAAA